MTSVPLEGALSSHRKGRLCLKRRKGTDTQSQSCGRPLFNSRLRVKMRDPQAVAAGIRKPCGHVTRRLRSKPHRLLAPWGTLPGTPSCVVQCQMEPALCPSCLCSVRAWGRGAPLRSCSFPPCLVQSWFQFLFLAGFTSCFWLMSCCQAVAGGQG